MARLKRFFDWVLTLNLILVTVVCAYLWWNGNLQISVTPPAEAPDAEVEATTINLFMTTLRSEVDRQIAQPSNGYTPEMFIAAFPGLTATDFEDVEASVGKYVVVEGQLIHVMPRGVPRHSAAAAVTSSGMVSLLENIATRGQIDLTSDGTITDIMGMISPES